MLEQVTGRVSAGLFDGIDVLVADLRNSEIRPVRTLVNIPTM